MILAAVEVFDLVSRECGVSFVGDLVTGVVGPDLDDVDLFAGKDHAFVGHEADALGLRMVCAGELADERIR